MKRHYGFLAISLALAIVVASIATGAMGAATHGVYRLVGLIGQILALVQTNYVEEIALDRLETGALAGLVEAADPGGAWVPAEQASAYDRFRRRSTPPFGIVLGKRSTYPVVVQVLPGSPAEAVDLAPGELIERVGDRPVRARPLWETELLFDAAERDGGALALDVISRDLSGKRLVRLSSGAPLPPAPYVEARSGIPVLRLVTVSDEAAMTLPRTLDTFADAPAIVVDLTGTALGDSRGAVAVAAAIAGGDVSLQWAGRGNERGTVEATGPERQWRVVVCVDGTTTQAGELLALALKRRGATLVGRESYGDTAQRQATHRDGGRLWLAQSWFLATDGTPLLESGLKPDDLVRGRGGRETILERALELARGEAPAKAA